jgi:hypothetical protein
MADIDPQHIQEPEMVEPTDDVELSEELADTAIINTAFEGFFQELNEMFADALDVSIEGNPVKTHIELTNLGQDLVEASYALRNELIQRLAKRTEELNLEEAATGRGWVYRKAP